MKTKFYFTYLSILLVIISCSNEEKKLDGLYFSRKFVNSENNPEFKINDPFLIISSDTLFSIKLINPIDFKIDTLLRKEKVFSNDEYRLNYKIVNDSILKIKGEDYFNKSMNVFNKKKYNAKNHLYIDKIVNRYWYSNNFASVEKINIDTLFLFLNFKNNMNKNKLYYYVGSSSKHEAAKGSWTYLNIGGFSILKLNIPFSAFVFVDESTDKQISGIVYPIVNKPINYNFFKNNNNDGFFEDYEKRKREKENKILRYGNVN